MTASNRIVLSSDHAAIQLRQAIAAHIAANGWVGGRHRIDDAGEHTLS